MELRRLNIVLFIFTLSVIVHGSNQQLTSELDTLINEIYSIRSEQINRAKDIIEQKKELAKEVGKQAVECTETEGYKYLQQIEENNVKYTSDFLEQLDGYKKALENGEDEKVKKALEETLKPNFESILTNLQAEGESITLAYVSKANQCRGLDH
ncbi:uncharacterized protein [Rhodnius prolixus]|uniref:uncharacterized protein n=1 Tax=Rhodnius prolixus TaxID=13249 RepID=UPI003D188FCF